jgi:hypothetical protein
MPRCLSGGPHCVCHRHISAPLCRYARYVPWETGCSRFACPEACIDPAHPDVECPPEASHMTEEVAIRLAIFGGTVALCVVCCIAKCCRTKRSSTKQRAASPAAP